MAKQKRDKAYDAKFEALKTKYFWKQKFSELGTAALYLFLWALIFVAFTIISPYDDSKGDINEYYALNILISLLIGGVLFLIYSFIKWWIQSNWEDADDKAREDLKLEERGEKYY
jgi:hypothetical protein